MATVELLGADLPYKLYFKHPTIEYINIHVVIDNPHMIKLARNCLAKGDLKFSDGGIVFWRYISALHHLQREEGLRYGNKLTDAHVTEWYRRKMQVKLATQVLSRSVADALQYLHDIGHKDFEDVEPTVKFLLLFDG